MTKHQTITQDELDVIARESYELMVNISKICHGQDKGIVLAALTRFTAKMTATAEDQNALEKVIWTLKELHADELREIKNAH